MAPTKRPNRAGRPPRAGKASTEIVKFRVTPDERRAWEQRATADGKTLSEWIRERCSVG